MRCTVRFAPEPQAQLYAIEDYIAIASGFPATAAHFVDGIIACCESFENFPERGTRRDGLLPGLRIIGYRKSVTVAFSVGADAQVVSIVGVFYGGQDCGTGLSNQGN